LLSPHPELDAQRRLTILSVATKDPDYATWFRKLDPLAKQLEYLARLGMATEL
jgi:hypothetical protein